MDFQNLKAFMDDMAKNHTVGNDCEVYLDGKSVFRYFSGWVERAREKTNGNFDTVTSIREFAKEPILFEPGTHWSYSLGHDVLAAFVSVVSGKKFRDYMKENIFDNLMIRMVNSPPCFIKNINN